MIGFVKAIAGFIVPVGTEAIVTSIAAGAVRNQGTLTKIAACASSLVIGWWAGDKAVEFLDGQLDEFQKKWEQYQLGGGD